MSCAHIPEPQRQAIIVAGRQCERAMHELAKANDRHNEIAADYARLAAERWSRLAFKQVRPA